MLEAVIGAMLKARGALWNEFTRLHREMLKIARADKVCRHLMSAPGIGALVAITYRSAVDDPGRFSKSPTVGAYFGLTPKILHGCPSTMLLGPTHSDPVQHTITLRDSHLLAYHQAAGPLRHLGSLMDTQSTASTR